MPPGLPGLPVLGNLLQFLLARRGGLVPLTEWVSMKNVEHKNAC